MTRRTARPATPPNPAPASLHDNALDILASLDDPNLFAPHFKEGTWTAWRAFLAALFGLPMTDTETETFRLRTGRTEPPLTPFREAALIVGRRGGKSRVLALIAVFLAVFRDYGPHLAPGEVATIGVLAANRDQARSIFRFISGLLKATPLLAGMVQDENTETIILSNRVHIEIGTASFRTTRGYSYAAVLADEIAFWRSDETSANPDVEILRALRPGMASIPGSILLLASSPYAKRGALYATFRRNYGRDDARVLVWKADTAAMNPSIDPAIIAEAYEEDPEAARAEYGGEFRDDLADFVTRETVDAVTCWGRTELPPEPGVAYLAFVDPSGGVSDAMTLAIAHIMPSGVVVLDAVREARPPFDPEATVKDFADTLRRYGVSTVTGDRYGGEWPRQRFREHGIEYNACARPKSDLYLDLLPLLNAGRVALLDNPRLSAQLVGLERRTARSGKDSVDHSPGGHDDLCNSVAGVLVGLDLDRRPALIKSAGLTTGGAAQPLPKRCDYIIGVIHIGDDGTTAITYWARDTPTDHLLILVDFDVQPLTMELFAAASRRMKEIAGVCPPRYAASLFVPAVLQENGWAAGSDVDIVPQYLFEHPASLALAASAHVASARVKMGAAALARVETYPLSASLDFKVTEALDGMQPLRTALLLGIAIALNPIDQARPAAA
ncbi:MAG TPA: hypothetical protein PK677_13840 [Acidiphilium sp.]|uniref:hypothetical protein n=1 Tax=unclassified Acidiphilium TaxID=2617493 RepID=UPI002580C95B|nr:MULTISPECIES: hypothetical protein [unclassified Acidiphilium]HQT89609.1 hypothetical protein [Acidiphilium sp.]